MTRPAEGPAVLSVLSLTGRTRGDRVGPGRTRPRRTGGTRWDQGELDQGGPDGT